MLSIALSAANHLFINWTLSGPLQEIEASSNLCTVCLKLLKFLFPCRKQTY